MEELKGYWEAIKGIALSTVSGIADADAREMKIICVSMVTFGILSVLISTPLAGVISSLVIGVMYAKSTK